MKPTVVVATEEQRVDVQSWPVWEHDPDTFDYSYDDKEEFYVVEGRARVKCDEGTVEFKAGDYVEMPKGLKCTWEILEKVVKHYRFGE